jgi:hypothetical protein
MAMVVTVVMAGDGDRRRRHDGMDGGDGGDGGSDGGVTAAMAAATAGGLADGMAAAMKYYGGDGGDGNEAMPTNRHRAINSTNLPSLWQ